MVISSTANPTIKRIRSLRQRKAREESGLFLVEGIRIVGEAVELGAGIETCVVAPELLTSAFANSLVRDRAASVPVVEVTNEVFRSISGKEGPQGVAAVVRQRWLTLDEIDPRGDVCWTALDAVQDPGNLGTILRTSDAVGGAGVILLGASADPHHPSAVRASMGAIFSQRLVRTGFHELCSWASRYGCMLVGTSDAGAEDYTAVRYRSPVVLLMGSERLGLSPEEQAACEVVARIPMAGRSDSLNLAVATGLMLYEIFNQRRRAREDRDAG